MPIDGAAAWAFSGGDVARTSAAASGTGLRGRILGGALGLELLGVEDAIASVAAFGQSVGVVLEGVRWSFRAGIDDVEGASLLRRE